MPAESSPPPRTAIGPDETAGELEERLAKLGAPLVARVVDALALGPVPVLPQDQEQGHQGAQAAQGRRRDRLVAARQAIHNLVRAMQPWPAASTSWQPGRSSPSTPLRLIVHRTEIATGEGLAAKCIEAAGDRLVVAGGRRCRRALADPTAREEAFHSR